MRQRTFAALAAVSAVALSVASGATAATVDTLIKAPFFPAGSPNYEVAGNFSGNIASVDVTEPAPFQITVSANPPANDGVDDALMAVLESPAGYFEGAAASKKPYTGGISTERAHTEMIYASGRPAGYGIHAKAIERGHMSAAEAAPAIAAVPLPASGLLLCFGLYGLSRIARRTA